MASTSKSVPANPPNPLDLAPGDLKSLKLDLTSLEFEQIHDPDDPLFLQGFDMLWDEFGAAGEIEQKEVLKNRLLWDPGIVCEGFSLLYEMVVALEKRRPVAVRDHTAIVIHGDAPHAFVHMSHVLVTPRWRRSGLAGWMRCYPVQTARCALAACGLPTDTPITLVAEMEPADRTDLSRMIRLAAYEKAGFRKIDPAALTYLQPDFRSPARIDAVGGPQPLIMALIVRQVRPDPPEVIQGADLKRMVTALYHMYGRHFRPSEMERPCESLRNYPPDDATIRLIPPTQ